ncbi:rhomboid family intramembrane serine protease [Candidatus Pacearchaeota archaeon]|nr:rhomboid family intramembrane serine protease [Candidatus Pacearchaeota archaeon]
MAKEKFRYYALKLSLLMIIIFVFQIIFPFFTDLFILNENSYFQRVAHLALNLFALVLFGLILENIIGGRKFLLIFISTGIFANFVSINFYSSSLGASGAIFGVIGSLIIIRPLLPVFAFGLPMPIFVAGVLWAGADILGTIGFFAGNPIDNTGNIAHLSGMFLGFLLGYFYRQKVNKTRKEKIRLDEGYIRRWENHFMRKDI